MNYKSQFYSRGIFLFLTLILILILSIPFINSVGVLVINDSDTGFFRLTSNDTDQFTKSYNINQTDCIQFSFSGQDYWAKGKIELDLKHDNNWFNKTQENINWTSFDLIGNNTEKGVLRCNGFIVQSGVKAYLNLTYSYNISDNRFKPPNTGGFLERIITLKPETYINESYLKYIFYAIKIDNTSDNDNATWYNINNQRRSKDLKLINYSTRDEAELGCNPLWNCSRGTLFQFTDQNSLVTAEGVIDPNGKTINDTFLIYGGLFPLANLTVRLHHNKTIEGNQTVSTELWWDDPITLVYTNLSLPVLNKTIMVGQSFNAEVTATCTGSGGALTTHHSIQYNNNSNLETGTLNYTIETSGVPEIILANTTRLTSTTCNGKTIMGNISIIGNREGIVWITANGTDATTKASSQKFIFVNVTNTSVCGDISGDVQLRNNVTSASTCFTIKANNVDLDCQGYKITYGTTGTGNAVLNSGGFDFVSIKNCIIQGSKGGATATAISFTRVTNSLIMNNTINANGTTTTDGIDIFSSSNHNRIENNTITTQKLGNYLGDSNFGIKIATSINVSILNNVIIANGSTNSYGMSIETLANDTIIINNSVFTAGNSFSNRGIRISDSARCIVTNNYISTSSTGSNSNWGLWVESGANNSYFANNYITTAGTATNNEGMRIETEANNNTFVNNTFLVDSISTYIIWDLTHDDINNTLKYNNSFGSITWINNGSGSFNRNMSFIVTNNLGFGLGKNLNIVNGTIGINSSAFASTAPNTGLGRINSTVNITLYAVGYPAVSNLTYFSGYNLTINSTHMALFGVNCTQSTCSNVNFFNGNINFNTSGLGTFSANFTITIPAIADITPPNVTNLAPTLNTVKEAGTTTIEVGANATDPSTVNLAYANITYPNASVIIYQLSNTVANRWNMTFTMPQRQLGLYTINFTANDSSNNINRTEYTNFTIVDTTKPNVTDKVPTLNSIAEFGDSMQISANGTDIVYSSKMFINITYPNSSIIPYELSNGTAGAPFKFNISFSPINLGLYYVNFSFNDSSNNFNKTEFTNFTVTDTIPPNVTTKTPSLNSVYEAGTIATIEIGVNVTDRVIVDSVFTNITYPNTSIILYQLSNSTGNFQRFNMTFTMPIQVGVYNVSFKANDSSNNYNQSEFTNFTIRDTTLPNVTLLYPPQNSLYNTSNIIYISANVTDIVGVSKVFANISYPNGSFIPFELTNVTQTPKRFNMTFVVPELTGYYNLTIIANDSSNNFNKTEFTNFTVKVSCGTVTKNTNLDQNIVTDSSCFIITTANIYLNCSGFNINGDRGTNDNGIDVQATGVKVLNCIVNDFYVGIYVDTTSGHGVVGNNTVYNNQLLGMIDIGIGNNTIEDNFIYSNQEYGMRFNGAENDTFRNNRLNNNTAGIHFMAGATGNLLNNNNITNDTLYSILDESLDTDINQLIYNTSLGDIRWIDNGSGSFMRNMTFNITNQNGLGLFRNLELGNNSIAFNTSAFNINRINSTANITFYGINLTSVTEIALLYNYTNNATFLSYYGQNCTKPSCSIISYSGNTLKFNVSFLGSFAGNDSTSGVVTDTTPPSIINLTPRRNSNFNALDDLEIGVNVTDVGGTVSLVFANITYPNGSIILYSLSNSTNNFNRFNFTFSIPRQLGLYNISFIANDTSNNYNRTEYTNFTALDNRSPNVTNKLPTLNSVIEFGNSVEISANGTDNMYISLAFANITYPNISTILYSLSNSTTGAGFKFNITFTVSNLGLFNVSYVFNDSSNNYNRTEFTNFTVTDTIPPNVTNLAPSLNTVVNLNTNSLEIGANITDRVIISNGFANITYPNGSIILYSLSNSTGNPQRFNFTFFVPNLLGLYNVSFKANDTSNNYNGTERTNFTIVDTTVPNVTTLIPILNSILEAGSFFQIAGNITDSIGVSKVYANMSYPNGSFILFELSLYSGTNKYNSSISSLNLGKHNFTIVSNDTSNNYNRTEFSNFTVTDTLKPNVTGFLPIRSSSYNTGQTIEISANVTDRIIVSIVNATIQEVGGTITQLSLSNSTGFPNKFNGSYTIPATTGVYNVTFSANDTSNNINNTEFTNFTALPDTTVPNVTGLIPTLNSQFNTQTSIEISAWVNDSSPISTVYANITAPNTTIIQITLSNSTGYPAKYNSSYLISIWAGLYNISFFANDTSNNINTTEKTNFTALDTTPPFSVTNLANQTVTDTTILWNWTNPTDVDFSQAILYLNGSNVANTSSNSYTATGLSGDTWYNLSINTKDVNGNINYTNISDIARTNTLPSGENVGGGAVSGGGGGDHNCIAGYVRINNLCVPINSLFNITSSREKPRETIIQKINNTINLIPEKIEEQIQKKPILKPLLLVILIFLILIGIAYIFNIDEDEKEPPSKRQVEKELEEKGYGKAPPSEAQVEKEMKDKGY